MDYGHGPLDNIKRYSLTQLFRYSEAAQRRDSIKQAALVRAVAVGSQSTSQAIQDEIKALLSQADKPSGKQSRKSRSKAMRSMQQERLTGK